MAFSLTLRKRRAGTATVTIANNGTDSTAGDYHAVEHANFLGANYIKVVSGSAEGAERTVTLVGWDVN